MTRPTYVFGYGSLAVVGGAPASRKPDRQDPDLYVTDVLGMRRSWGVAMDNARTIPGYKYYVDPETGDRPEVFVSFLDLREDPTAEVNGVCRQVDPDDLAALDERERNYARVDVTDRVTQPLGQVWAYLGTEAGRERFEAGRRSGRAVADRGYRDAVEAGFRSLGEEEHRRYLSSTDALDLPLRDLDRIDLSAP